jgi:FkbM family methyltransferase
MSLTTSTIDPFGTYRPNRFQDLARDIGRRLPRSWSGKRISAWLRSILKSTAHQPIDVMVLGHRMRLHMGDNACERRLMVTPQFFDPEELAILRSAIRPGFQFIDLGANVGTYSLLVAHRAGPGARVLAIEPQAVILERLRENIALNNLDIMVAPVAVSDHEGIIEFKTDENNLGGTSIHLDRKGRGDHSLKRFPARKLLNLVQEHGFARIDALKADIEGAEDVALIPFFDEAPRSLWPRLMIIEVNGREWRRDCVAHLIGLGYTALMVPKEGNAVLELRA